MANYYTLVPHPVGPFAALGPVERVVWGTIWERFRLSEYHVTGGKDSWYDYDEDAIYCIYGQRELAAQVGVSERTIRRALDNLYEACLIDWRKADYKGACRYYFPRQVREYMAALRKDSRQDA